MTGPTTSSIWRMAREVPAASLHMQEGGTGQPAWHAHPDTLKEGYRT